MRFAFISVMEDSQWAACEELWSQAAIQLRREGHDVLASVAYWPRPSERVTGLAQHHISFKAHPSSQAGQGMRIWNKFSLSRRRGYERLKRFKPDLAVISQGGNSGGFGWANTCREAGIPYVIIVHCNSENWWFQDQFNQAVASYTAAHKVFCVSRGNLDVLRLQLGEPLLNAEIVRNPFNVSPDNSLAWPDETGSWRMACVARLFLAAKGQDLLLQTMARSEWRSRPVELNLYGAGVDEPVLRRMAESFHLKNVHFRGYINDVAGIWEQNHLLVLPSRYEGLPLALVEAMWCSRPAVVTDVGGNAELCIDGETGFVAPFPSLTSFSVALERAWERRGDWAQMGQQSRTVVGNKIPKEPVGPFCDRLRACAVAATGAQHGSRSR